MEMGAAYDPRTKQKIGNDSNWRVIKLEKAHAWQKAIDQLDHERVLVKLVCSKDCTNTFNMGSRTIRENASKLFKGIASNYADIGIDVQKAIFAVYRAARKEIGSDLETLTASPNESSAPPSHG